MDSGVRFLNGIQNETQISTARLVPTQLLSENATSPLMPTRTNLIMVNGRLQKIPRPQNAFMLFANDHRKEFLNRFPTQCNSKISTKLGEAWATLPTVQKDEYYKKAQAADMEHKKKYPFYHYTPSMSKVQKRKYQTSRRIAQEQARRHHVSQAIKYQRETLQSLVQSINGVIYASKLADARRDDIIEDRKDKDDMQVLTPVRAQQMISKVQFGNSSSAIPNASLQVRPRRGRPPKIRPIPAISDPVPAAPRRGRPRKYPAVIKSTPTVSQAGHQMSSFSNPGAVKSPSALNSMTTSTGQRADRDPVYFLPQVISNDTSGARYTPISAPKPIYPDTFVFKNHNGGTLGMKLIPISETNTQGQMSTNSDTSIPGGTTTNSGTNIKHGIGVVGPSGRMVVSQSGTNIHNRTGSISGTTICIQNRARMQNETNAQGGSHTSIVTGIQSETNAQIENHARSGDNTPSQMSNQNETVIQSGMNIQGEVIFENNSCESNTQNGSIVQNGDNANIKISNANALNQPITIQPCHPDSLTQGRHDTSIHTPSLTEPQNESLENEPFNSLPPYMKEIIQIPDDDDRGNELSYDGPPPMLADSKESIPILDDGIQISSNHSNDGMDVLYPCNVFTPSSHMVCGTQVPAGYMQTTCPPSNPMEIYKSAAVSPDPYQYQAGDYQAGWGEPYTRIARAPYGGYAQHPTMLRQYPPSNYGQYSATQHYMQYPEEYTTGNPSTSAEVYNNEPKAYHSSGDGLASSLGEDMRVKSEAESSYPGLVRPVITEQVALAQHRSTADHITDALRTLTD